MTIIRIPDPPFDCLPARFAIRRSDGTRSAAWITWSSKRKSDIYLAGRVTAGVSKVSLHESGICQWGYTSEAIARDPALLEQMGGKHRTMRWTMPDNLGGSSLPLRMLFPHDHLTLGWPPLSKEAETLYIEPPDGTSVTEILFTILAPGHDKGGFPSMLDFPSEPICKSLLPNQTTFWISARHHNNRQIVDPAIERGRTIADQLRRGREAQGADLDSPTERTVAVGEVTDGSYAIVELRGNGFETA